MKKSFYLILVILFSLITSCSNENREYTLVYKVYYSTNSVVEKTVKSSKGFQIGSSRGSNYICNQDNGYYLIDTSAPVEVISYTYKVIQ